MTEACLACDLAAGRAPLPGGLIHERDGWRVEHCVGPLGVGTLIVKPLRHVTAVRDLEPDEAAALGPLLREAADVADRLVDADQVYVCLWSHAGGEPGHIHWVVQPVTRRQLEDHGRHGPALQMAMFEQDVTPDPAAVDELADRARALFAGPHRTTPVGEASPLRSAEEIAAFLGVAVPGPQDIEVRSGDVEDRPGYRLRTIHYRGDEGDDITAFRLEPTAPIGVGVVLLHQHNGEWHLGKSEAVGLAGNPLQAFGPALAAAGVTVLAPDALCFEDRRRNASGTAPRDGDDLQQYNELAYRLLDGDTLARKVLQDAVTAVTVLEQEEGLTAIGALGHSFGGHTTLFLSAIDRRVAFACVSGAAGSYRARMANDIGIGFDHVVPGLARRMDFGTLAACVAPRPLLLVAGDDDRYALDAPAIAEEARDTYRSHDVADRLECEVFPGEHAMTEERHARIVDWVTRQCRAVAAAG